MIMQFFLAALSIGLPIPCGLVTPVFVAGAAGGRLVGEIMRAWTGVDTIHPASYAVVGAAAFSSGTTRTLATSIVVFGSSSLPDSVDSYDKSTNPDFIITTTRTYWSAIIAVAGFISCVDLSDGR
jgi:hypothetical protein